MAWTLAAALIGLASSGVFATFLGWDRSLFVAAHAALVALFTAACFFWNHISVRVQFGRRWRSGAAVGLLVAIPLVRNVLSQPASPRPEGGALVWALGWLGLVYGVADAILLSVLPVLMLYGTRSAETLHHPGRRLGWGLAALAGSLLVAAAYHLGFAEFRGPHLVAPLIGNAIITTGYLLTGSPVTPVVSHVLMHGAAVFHGLATTTQIPPHY
ncbi:MAG: hypothetical protein H6R40_304 [Gemmatimonadetes bacterium]|nr:hypothetical protein [Gemmatimonadota bacterium]